MKDHSRAIRQLITIPNISKMLIVSILCSFLIILSMTGTDALVSSLLHVSGDPAITSGNYRIFFRSWHGYAVVLITEVILLVTVAALINMVILLAEDLRRGVPVRPISLLFRGISRIRLFMCRQGVPVILYYIVFFPAITVTLFFVIPNPFEIPGFISYQIHKKLLYRVSYIFVMVVLTALQLRNMFLLHDVVLENETLPEARQRAKRMIREHRRQAYPALLAAVVMAAVVILGGLAVFRLLPLALQNITIHIPRLISRYIVLFGTCLGLLVLALCVLLAPWIVILSMSEIYDRLRGKEPVKARVSAEDKAPASAADEELSRRKRNRLAPAISLAGVLIIAVVSWVLLVHFEYLFPRARRVEAVVHRLGGDLDIENTLEGQEAALELGAGAAETDIQRTKDGEYIIFHDGTLKRLCGMPDRPCDLTLDEIRSIEMQTVTGEVRKIPTLEEVLDKAKGREVLYLELKGVTADEQMADDVIAMLKEKGMEQDCILISMNYHVIRYIDRNYPDIRCGYLYFFAYGNESRLEADLLMSQSNVINPSKTSAIHRAGKQLYCWTVNSRGTAKAMIRRRVDGIISDRYDIIQSVLDHLESRTDYERIMDVLVN
ncbi:MAG: glycerophosphoryl diester phosphodiesterase membrane domain-containing protein [Lachnospiraceae bacterium]|nr:glycerophosphoryl diester phosphodiesterase membrane domain-containing protein [Lachnospiraceae bacterium]